MAIFKISTNRLAMATAILALPLVVSGCQGSSATYGTGKTSFEHLADGLGGVLGSKAKKKPINYSTRPGLVKPPQTAALPEPVLGGTSSFDGDLPEDPELRRARMLGQAPKVHERSGALPIEFMQKRKRDPKTAKVVPVQKWDRDGTLEDYNPRLQRKQYLKRKAELAGIRGTADRKYLTEPPKQYRTPADTAPVGEIGESESSKARKRKGKKNFRWSDFNPFG
jgi:hypothetical protein